MSRLRLRFTAGWIFHRGEIDVPPARSGPKSGYSGGPSDAVGAERGGPDPGGMAPPIIPGLDADGGLRITELGPGWEAVRIPHDWRIDEPPVNSTRGPRGYPLQWQGFQPAGIGYYRKTFTVPVEWMGRRIRIDFEGVMRRSTVWMNGHLVGEHLSGYTSFGYDVSDVVRYGDEGDNVLLLSCDAREPEGWWGEGAGLYRPVWLTVTDPLHVAGEGVCVSTRGNTVHVETEIANDDHVPRDLTLVSTVLDRQGTEVAQARSALTVPAVGAQRAVQSIIVDAPMLWDVDSPHLYTLVSELLTGGETVDGVRTTFGFRELAFTADSGFLLNGRRLQLWGANVHQDFGGLGIALPERVIEHRLELLAEMGCNTIRSAHHPPTEYLLDACDRAGLLVIDENRHLDSSEDGLRELEAMIRRDRNHPCVIAWGLENEEVLEGTTTGARILGTLAARAHSLDATRPTLVAGTFRLDASEYYDRVDVVGYNYKGLEGSMSRHHAEHPARAMLATEEALFPTTRGCWSDDVAAGHLSEYGTEIPIFGNAGRGAPGAIWDFYEQNPWIAGALVWAGFDYRGEPYPLGWPCVSSHFGAHDVGGFPKSYATLLRTYFRAEPLLRLFPHWTWSGREGELVDVLAYTNCDEVELWVNGSSAGRVRPEQHRATWRVPYEPGELRAGGWRDGKLVAGDAVSTSGRAARVSLMADAHETHGIAIVRATVADDAARTVPDANHEIQFSIEGAGTVLGTANGDPADHVPARSSLRRAFNGMLVAVVAADAQGEITVTATSPGLAPGRLMIAVRAPLAGDVRPDA